MVPSFEKRVRAFAIDTSGVMIFVILSLFTGTEIRAIPYIISVTAAFVFYVLPHFFSRGQTFGKRIQKIKTVDLDGNDLKLWRIILRDVFRLALSFMTFGLYLIIAFFFINEKTSRTIHDYIFKTKVIDLEKPVGKMNFMNKTESMRKKGL
ncbi:MAG: RDD family protein [Acholeplasmataceae bacterium]|nr:RDD family protein [Acholeplasmataceae bacterium]